MIKSLILETVANSEKKLTPRDLEKILLQRQPSDHYEIKTVIRDLVSEGVLTYTYIYGCSFLERSFHKAVRISRKIVLKPPEIFYRGKPGDVVIKIQPGVSFGTGQHPTTRLALRGIEQAILNEELIKKKKETSALDIGTGSGILAIAAVLLGINTAVGIDIDPCARVEAKENIKINELEDHVVIENLTAEKFSAQFSLIIANLRYPTLRRIRNNIFRITANGGSIVLSGIKAHEMEALVENYTTKGLEVRWYETEKSWAALHLRKNLKESPALINPH
jgi:ribosomal protein L11 methyltransferase